MSRWSSPIPLTIVCPVSSSVRTRHVGSSSESIWRASPSLSLSARDFGSIAMNITGSGNSMRSSAICACSAQTVSPVVNFPMPPSTPISPA